MQPNVLTSYLPDQILKQTLHFRPRKTILHQNMSSLPSLSLSQSIVFTITLHHCQHIPLPLHNLSTKFHIMKKFPSSKMSSSRKMPSLYHSYASCKDPFSCTHLTHALSPVIRARTADEEEIILFRKKKPLNTATPQHHHNIPPIKKIISSAELPKTASAYPTPKTSTPSSSSRTSTPRQAITPSTPPPTQNVPP